jgi:hypothetical protein
VALEEPQPDKGKLKLVTDGKGRFLAYWFKEVRGIPEGLYWSEDGKDFYRQRTYAGSADGEKFGLLMFEPRIASNTGFDFKDGKYEANCGEKKVEFKLVGPEQAKAVLDGATFYKMRWTRKPYALSRDEKGTYYFVDHLRNDDSRAERKRDFRLFVGPRGQLKEQKMTNLVSDSEGDIFGTKAGDFRLVLNREKEKVSKWVTGSKETALTSVPVDDNVQVIYNDLGVYERAKLGTPCDVY